LNKDCIENYAHLERHSIIQKIEYIYIMGLSPTETNLLQQYFADKPVKKVYLFGSYARNTAVKGSSDIDILLDLDYSKPIGMKFFSYQRELEDLLKNKVDVITSDGISKYVQPHIEKDKVLIYEARA
jgi:predicted nucleotidyltransferase